MSIHDPLSRKRTFGDLDPGDAPITKKVKNEDPDASEEDKSGAFSEMMFHTYVESALESLDRVCISLGKKKS